MVTPVTTTTGAFRTHREILGFITAFTSTQLHYTVLHHYPVTQSWRLGQNFAQQKVAKQMFCFIYLVKAGIPVSDVSRVYCTTV